MLESPVRVLVVDDDQLTRKLMRRMLTRLGCSVSTAENGQIALELITGGGRTPGSDGHDAFSSSPVKETPPKEHEGPRYEVIFLDNQMPVLSGLELVSKLREMGRDDFVVGVTGNALLSDQEEYREAGVD
jgi:osomolarity two-component system, sensor histidine kinase SLN1